MREYVSFDVFIIYNLHFIYYTYFKGREWQREIDTGSLLKSPQLKWGRPKLGGRNTGQTSHKASRHPSTGAVIWFYPGWMLVGNWNWIQTFRWDMEVPSNILNSTANTHYTLCRFRPTFTVFHFVNFGNYHRALRNKHTKHTDTTFIPNEMNSGLGFLHRSSRVSVKEFQHASEFKSVKLSIFGHTWTVYTFTKSKNNKKSWKYRWMLG